MGLLHMSQAERSEYDEKMMSIVDGIHAEEDEFREYNFFRRLGYLEAKREIEEVLFGHELQANRVLIDMIKAKEKGLSVAEYHEEVKEFERQHEFWEAKKQLGKAEYHIEQYQKEEKLKNGSKRDNRIELFLKNQAQVVE